MKILRSVNRRGFSVGSAGWFTTVKPNPWFAASRLGKRPYHLSSQAEPTVRREIPHPTTPFVSAKLDAKDPGWMLLAFSILGAVAVASALVWWLVSQAVPNGYSLQW